MSDATIKFFKDRDALVREASRRFDNAVLKSLEDFPVELKNHSALSQAGLHKQKISKLLQISQTVRHPKNFDIASIEHTIVTEAANAVIQCLEYGGFILGLDLESQLRNMHFGRKLGIKAKVLRKLVLELTNQSQKIWSTRDKFGQEHSTICVLRGSIFLYESATVSWDGGSSTLVPISRHRASKLSGLPL